VHWWQRSVALRMAKTVVRRDLLCTASVCWLVAVLVVYFTLGPQLMAGRTGTRLESRLGFWEGKGRPWSKEQSGAENGHSKREVLRYGYFRYSTQASSRESP